MSKFYSVGRSSRRRRQSILVLVLIIISSSVFTNILAILNKKIKYSEDITCFISTCDMIEHMMVKSNDFLSKARSQGKEYLAKLGYDDFQSAIKEEPEVPIRIVVRVLKDIPKNLSEPTNRNTLHRMNNHDMLEKIYVDLHHLIFHLGRIKQVVDHPPHGFFHMDKSNHSKPLLNFLYTDSKEFVIRIESLLPALGAQVPSISFADPDLFRDFIWLIRSLLSEYILLFEFINDIMKYWSAHYCDDLVRDANITPDIKFCHYLVAD